SGGIFSAADAQEMFDAGADAVQLCSVIYHRGMPVIEEFTRKAA
ncbi:hypothetical protein KY363_03735, partial [Candidatus Woesearchaeota archaeon]|nr:hypothetical protein [Candidatus Woesearchaeota archaeon]